MTTDTTSEISENPKKKKQIQHSDENKKSKKERDRHEDTVWCCSYCLSPLDVAKENKTEIFEITTLHLKPFKTFLKILQLLREWRGASG